MASSILVDCCALADLFVGEESFRAEAEALRRKWPHWRASPLIVYEFGNVLRTQVAAGKLTETHAVTCFSAGLALVDISEDPTPEKILQWAIQRKLTFYDATHVAIANKLGLTLFTRDKEILANCPDVAKKISVPKT
jgi:predicted nucleic acid-binding protein